MKRQPLLRPALPRAQLIAERALNTLEHYLHIEALSGVVLLLAAITALIWANSPLAHSYEALWHAPLGMRLGPWEFSQSLHFWINDALMTVFFLVVGMEIRRELHEGALSRPRQAILPLAAAIGGVVVPALIYLAVNSDATRIDGWAVPTATDIAFAVGVLALLGRGIPSDLRIFLLALAIIDDVIAVLIIALFYSGGLDYSGFAVAGAGILLVLGLQHIGIGTAYAYLIPGAVIWGGLLMTGAHPTLAGVVLGLMTPVYSQRLREHPVDMLSRASGVVINSADDASSAAQQQLLPALRDLRLAHREMLPPVVRLQMTLHPWVAFGIMPLFALANAGVDLGGVDFAAEGPQWVILGITLALMLGKPAGIIGVSWVMVKLGWSQLPPQLNWRGVGLIGLLAGIGFTMSIFIAMLAFDDAGLLGAAKLGVLLGSLGAALLGLGWGVLNRGRFEPRAESVRP